MWTPAVPTIISGTMKRHNPDACQHWKGFSRYLRSRFVALKPSRVRENGRDLARSVGETRFFLTDGISPTSSASIIVTEKSRSSFSIASRVIVLARQRCVRRRELSGLSSVDIHVDDHVRGAKSPMIIRRAIERSRCFSSAFSVAQRGGAFASRGERAAHSAARNVQRKYTRGKSSSDARGD